jgi:hypothetical protein
MVVRASPILSFSLYSTNTIGPAIRAPPIGEAQRTLKNPRKLLIGATNSPRFAYRCGERSPALPISARCHAPPIFLAVAAIQRQYYWRYVARSASPILPELAHNPGRSGRKRKYGENKTKFK